MYATLDGGSCEDSFSTLIKEILQQPASANLSHVCSLFFIMSGCSHCQHNNITSFLSRYVASVN